PQIGPPAAVSRSPKGAGQLRAAIAELDVIPVFGPACERALSAAAFGGADAELVSASESDIGLTVAVLRLAGRRGEHPRGHRPAPETDLPVADRVRGAAPPEPHPCAGGGPGRGPAGSAGEA